MCNTCLFLYSPNPISIFNPFFPAPSLNPPPLHQNPLDNEQNIVTSYFDIKAFVDNHKYILMAANCQSLNKNIDAIRDAVIELRPTVIVVTETWHPHVTYVRVPGFADIELKTRTNQKGGGVGTVSYTHLTLPTIYSV